MTQVRCLFPTQEKEVLRNAWIGKQKQNPQTVPFQPSYNLGLSVMPTERSQTVLRVLGKHGSQVT